MKLFISLATLDRSASRRRWTSAVLMELTDQVAAEVKTLGLRSR